MTLSLDPAQFTAAQKKAASEFVKTRDQFKKNAGEIEKSGRTAADQIKQMGKNALELFAVLTATSSIKDFVAQTTAAGVALGNLAKNLQSSPQDISTLGLALERIGGTVDEATAAYQRLAEARTKAQFGAPVEFQRELNLLAAAGTGKAINFRGESTMSFLSDLAANAEIVAQKQGRTVAYNFLKTITGSENLSTLLLQGKAGLAKALGEARPFAIKQEDVNASTQLWTIWAKLGQEATSFGRTILTEVTPAIVAAATETGKFVDRLRSGEKSLEAGEAGARVGTDIGNIFKKQQGTTSSSGGLLYWLQELFGIGGAHASELGPYRGHGPGRRPTGIVSPSALLGLRNPRSSITEGVAEGSPAAQTMILVGRLSELTQAIVVLIRTIRSLALGNGSGLGVGSAAAAAAGFVGPSGDATSPGPSSSSSGPSRRRGNANISPSDAPNIKSLGVTGAAFNAKAPKLVERMMADFGLTREQAVGAVGWMAGETAGTLSPSIVRKGGTDTGYAQWVGPRRSGLYAMAGVPLGQAGKLTDEDNYKWLTHELRTNYAFVLPQLRRAKTWQEALKIWGKLFEGAGGTPGGLEGNTRTHTPWGARVNALSTGMRNPGSTMLDAGPGPYTTDMHPGVSHIKRLADAIAGARAAAHKPEQDDDAVGKLIQEYYKKNGRYPWQPDPRIAKLSQSAKLAGTLVHANSNTSSNQSTETNINNLHVHSAADNAAGIATDIHSALRRSSAATQANYGPA